MDHSLSREPLEKPPEKYFWLHNEVIKLDFSSLWVSQEALLVGIVKKYMSILNESVFVIILYWYKYFHSYQITNRNHVEWVFQQKIVWYKKSHP